MACALLLLIGAINTAAADAALVDPEFAGDGYFELEARGTESSISTSSGTARSF